MIRARYRNGLIYPLEPIPPEWLDGQEVRVEPEATVPSDELKEIELWDAEWRQMGPIQYEPGERERVRLALEEADALAKTGVRREMGLG